MGGGPTGTRRVARGSGGDAGSRRMRRRDSATAVIDAIYPEASPGASPADTGMDLQSLLSEALLRVCRLSAADHACAWIRGADGLAMPMATFRREGSPIAPRAEVFEALCRLRVATDLGALPRGSGLPAFAAASGVSAAAPLRIGETRRPKAGRTVGVLLLGGPDDRPGRVRPRTLALLSEQAELLSGPLRAIGALERIERLDATVMQLDRLASLGELLTEIVHEIRNPLVSVKTFLQLLPDRLEDAEFVGEFRGVVSEEVTRLERLLEGVLRLGASGRQERVVGGVAATHAESGAAADVADTFAMTRQLLAHRMRERKVRAEEQIDPGVDEVAISPDALRQLLLNLALNALDVAPVGSRVLFEARRRTSSEGRVVEIAVEDEGEGVAPEARERIFEAFYSTRDGSAGGLGLAISQRLVNEVGGSIRVESGAAGGARFVVTLLAGRPSPPVDEVAS